MGTRPCWRASYDGEEKDRKEVFEKFEEALDYFEGDAYRPEEFIEKL